MEQKTQVHQRHLLIFLLVEQPRGKQIREHKIKSSPKKYEPKSGIRLSAGGNPGDSGSGASSWEEDNLIPPEERWKDDPDYWADYKYNREDFKKKKKLEKEVCSISDPLQNKTGIKELSDSSSGKYLYKIDTKTAREELNKVWKDPKAKKERSWIKQNVSGFLSKF